MPACAHTGAAPVSARVKGLSNEAPGPAAGQKCKPEALGLAGVQTGKAFYSSGLLVLLSNI